MPFNNVVGQKQAKQFLLKALERDRLGHAYLFSGPDGVGKTLLAVEFAKILFCRLGGNDSCGACGDCRMIAHGRHPDLSLVEAEPESRDIKIEQIRDVRDTLTLTPVQAERRVAVIRDADLIGMAAANAFLKTLEEPAPFAHLILTTSRPRRLPSTIRSRCQELRFSPLEPDDIRKILSACAAAELDDTSVECPDYTEEEIRKAALFAEGSAVRAVRVIESGCLDVYPAVLDEMLRLPRGDMFALSDAILEWLHSISRKLEPQRRRLRELLRIISCAYRDMLLLRSSALKETLMHRDRADDLGRYAQSLPAGRILSIIEAIWEARRQVDANAALNLVVDNLIARASDLQSV